MSYDPGYVIAVFIYSIVLTVAMEPSLRILGKQRRQHLETQLEKFDRLMSIDQPTKEAFRIKAATLEASHLRRLAFQQKILVRVGMFLFLIPWLNFSFVALARWTGRPLGIPVPSPETTVPATVAITIIIGWAATLLYVHELVLRKTAIGYADSEGVVFDALLDALALAESAPSGSPAWGSPKTARKMAHKLEMVAKAIGLRFEAFRGDRHNAAWLREERERLIAAARRSKRLVYLPGPGGRDELVKGLGEDVVCVLASDWAGLARVDPPPEPVRSRASRLMDRLRPLVGALVILGVFWVLTQPFMPFRRTGDSAKYLTPLVPVAILLLLRALCPGLIKDLSTVENIRKLFGKG